MIVYTIGFAGKDAARFFGLLDQHKIRTLIDIRLNNSSQLAGFTKSRDLEFFLRKISDIDYRYMPELAPSKELLGNYRKHELDWDGYVQEYEALMVSRNADKFLKTELKLVAKPFCLLCSEAEAGFCHRRLLAERIQKLYPSTKIVHL